MVKKIIFKLFFLALLLVVLNFIYSKWFFESDIQAQSAIINLVRNVPENADIIYIGESSNTSYLESDLDKRTISDFIGDYYPNLNTYHISKPGSHAGIYKVLLNEIPKENNAQTVIVTLNLRSFNAQWIYSDLETSLQKSLVLLNEYPPLLNRFLLSFKAYDIKTNEERSMQFNEKWLKDTFDMPSDFPYNNTAEWDYAMATSEKFDQEKIELACHYIKAYSFQIDFENNPRIKDFDDIIVLAKERNWNLVFNLLAENTQKADQLVGDELLFMMNQNAEKLIKYFEKQGVVVVNNLNSVDDEQFIDQNWTTEHYAEKGRKIIAKNVAESLKLFHHKKYNSLK